jgi:hypothetical protein
MTDSTAACTERLQNPSSRWQFEGWQTASGKRHMGEVKMGVEVELMGAQSAATRLRALHAGLVGV